MRVILLAALALTACANRPQPTASEQAQRAQIEAEWHDPAARAARYRAAQNPPQEAPASERRAMLAADRDRQAAAICAGRAQVAGTTPVFGGFGLHGVMMGVTQQEIARVNTGNTCMEVYRQTGIMPAF